MHSVALAHVTPERLSFASDDDQVGVWVRTGAAGVTAAEVPRTPVPAALVAVRLKVYAVPLVSPLTVVEMAEPAIDPRPVQEPHAGLTDNE